MPRSSAGHQHWQPDPEWPLRQTFGRQHQRRSSRWRTLPGVRLVQRRSSRSWILFASLACLFFYLWWFEFVSVIKIRIAIHYAVDPSFKLPPSYGRWYEDERALPQHDLALPPPEGAMGRYFYPANFISGRGWNNALQELIFLSHLAYLANRSFVFEPYTWNKRPHEPYSSWEGHLIPSRIPLSAFISGPTAGGSFGDQENVPRAVTAEHWQKVCPNPTVIKSHDVVAHFDSSSDANALMQKWAQALNSMEERCVEIDPRAPELFDWRTFGSSSVLSLWDSLSASPILTRFAWSPLVTSAVVDNADIFLSSSSSNWPLASTSNTSMDLPRSIDGLLAIHIRRGDYSHHCKHLAKFSSPFMGFAQFPSLPDSFDPPAGGPTPENFAIFRQRCWPSIAEITEKIRRVLRTEEAKGVTRLYIMTNGDTKWVRELQSAMSAIWPWEGIGSSRDMRYTPEQKYVSSAIDMAIAERAQVFIGNGWSSMTSNIVMFRMADGKPPGSIRFL